MSNRNDWIFYLNLSSKLDRQFFTLDSSLKQRGISLIPVNIQELTALSRGEGKIHIFCLINSTSRLRFFNKAIRKIMRMLLQSSRVHFHIASSFSTIDDTALYAKRENYHFTSLPIKMEEYTNRTVELIQMSHSEANSWPGAKRRVYPHGEKI